MSSIPIRFEADTHTYSHAETGEVYPHITGLLERAGVVDDRWFTEESSLRGQEVHALTARYDLGVLDEEALRASDWPYKGYVFAYLKAARVIAPKEVQKVEEPVVHPRLAFGGRPDRVGRFYDLYGVLEIKTAAPARSHSIQTALQAILEEPFLGVPPEHQIRLCLYLKPRGRYHLVEHTSRRDFDEAYRILREYT